MTPSKSRLLLTAGAALAAAPAALASPVTLTFDDVPLGAAADGISLQGVTFAANRADTTVGIGPGRTEFTDAPLIEGSTAEDGFGFSFDQPVERFSFGIAFSTFDVLPLGGIVQVTTETGDQQEVAFSVDMLNIDETVAENLVEVAFFDSVVSAFVRFDETAARFAFDNLEYVPISGGDDDVNVIPLPHSAGLAMAGLGWVIRRERRRR